VEFALKLGYSECLLQKALLKVGLAAQQNELLDELFRLQHIRAVDPKVRLRFF
jgi:UBA-like domain